MNGEKAITNQKAFDFVVMLLNSGFISLAVFADATGLSYEEAGTYLKEDADMISRAELEKPKQPEPTSDAVKILCKRYGTSLAEIAIDLETKNERRKEGFELYLVLTTEQNFTPLEVLKKIEIFLGKRYNLKNIITNRVIGNMRKDLEQALKEK